MHKSVKAVIKLVAEIIIVCGALACVLAWLNITPKEVAKIMTWPHWMWLFIGLALFAISVYSSLRSFLVQTHDRNEVVKLTGELSKTKELLDSERLISSVTAKTGGLPGASVPKAELPPPKLIFTITEGFCAERPVEPNKTIILLNVRVDAGQPGPPIRILRWNLFLKTNAIWATDYQVISKPILFRAEQQNVMEEAREATQISEIVPTEGGWIQFNQNFTPEYRERHIFGATFDLTALTPEGERIHFEKKAAEWLHRAGVLGL